MGEAVQLAHSLPSSLSEALLSAAKASFFTSVNKRLQRGQRAGSMLIVLRECDVPVGKRYSVNN